MHHSTDHAEANSNFGFNLSIWDRLFGTYRAQARLPQERMEIGVTGLTAIQVDVSERLLDALEAIDDVQEVYTTALLENA